MTYCKKLFIPVCLLFLLSCGNSRVRKNESRKDSTLSSSLMPLPDSIKIADNSGITPVENEGKIANGDTVRPEQNDEVIRYGGFKKTPACIREMIAKFTKEEVTNPPRKIYQYDYKGQIVFYVPALCCDFFSDLYDMDCKLIGHPDGGFSGRGDGSFPDFIKVRKHERLVWEDGR